MSFCKGRVHDVPNACSEAASCQHSIHASCFCANHASLIIYGGVGHPTHKLLVSARFAVCSCPSLPMSHQLIGPLPSRVPHRQHSMGHQLTSRRVSKTLLIPQLTFTSSRCNTGTLPGCHSCRNKSIQSQLLHVYA